MMKTLCVAVVVLSLTSVCQPASLACEKLLKPLDKGPDLTGRWHYIAVSSDVCLASTVVNVFRPSAEVNITSKDTPNVYNVDFKVKMYGYCLHLSKPLLYENNTMVDIDSNTGESDVLLQSGCPDCIVIKRDSDINLLLLFSRRETVTAAELKEFETQAECHGWSKLQVLSSDYDYENCTKIEDIYGAESKTAAAMMFERVKNMNQSIIKCEPFYETFPMLLTK